MRKCKECGREIGVFTACVCVVCGKEYCYDHIGGKLVDDPGVEGKHLCPEHYKEVKEHIEGMKPKQVAEDLCVGGYEKLFVIRSSKGATEAWIGDTKFVPEEPLKPKVTKLFGGYSVKIGLDIAEWDLPQPAADALYEHMRRERGED